MDETQCYVLTRQTSIFFLDTKARVICHFWNLVEIPTNSHHRITNQPTNKTNNPNQREMICVCGSQCCSTKFGYRIVDIRLESWYTLPNFIPHSFPLFVFFFYCFNLLQNSSIFFFLFDMLYLPPTFHIDIPPFFIMNHNKYIRIVRFFSMSNQEFRVQFIFYSTALRVITYSTGGSL